MNDTPATDADQATDDQPALAVNGQYIKDLSFEAPNTPTILAELQNQQPDVNVKVDVQASKLEGQGADNMFEVTLDIQAELKLAEKVGFIVELKYAGVFTVTVPNEHLGAMLLIECPRMLFPFARNIISDTTRDGGFVPLMLQPIDFAGMYQANLARQVAEADQTVADLSKTEGNA